MLERINSHLYEWHSRTGEAATLYAVVDGVQAKAVGGGEIERDAGSVALFDDTVDSTLAAAGPWLVKIDRSSADNLRKVTALSESPAGVVWLISELPIETLATELTARLDVNLSDGSIALLRFYDTKVLSDLGKTLTEGQHSEFFAPAREWVIQCGEQFEVVHSTDR